MCDHVPPISSNNPFAGAEATFLPQKALAKRWGLSSRTLERWRRRKTGPDFVRIGRAVRYPLAAVEEYEALHRQRVAEHAGTHRSA